MYWGAARRSVEVAVQHAIEINLRVNDAIGFEYLVEQFPFAAVKGTGSGGHVYRISPFRCFDVGFELRCSFDQDRDGLIGVLQGVLAALERRLGEGAD